MGRLEGEVLATALHLGEGATAVTIRASLARVRRRVPARGAVYTTLARLEAKGLLRSSIGDPTPVRGGRAQRYYVVTGAGKRVIRAEGEAATTVARWWRGVMGARR